MLQIIIKLIEIRFRKFLPPKDKTAIVLFLCFYIFLTFILNSYYKLVHNFVFVFSIEILSYQINRKDLELLKLYKNYKILLFAEYLIYSLPVLVVIAIHLDFLQLFLYLSLIVVYLNTFKISSKKFNYPFLLFDPFWHISFRKNKLWLALPIPLLFIYLGISHHNDNLIIASFFINGMITSSVFFNREWPSFLKSTAFTPKLFIVKSVKTTLINTSMIVIPSVITLLLLNKIELLLFIPLLFIFPLLNMLLKYAYFTNLFLQQIYFVLAIGSIIQIYLVPVVIILLPIIYKKALINIQTIQYAHN